MLRYRTATLIFAIGAAIIFSTPSHSMSGSTWYENCSKWSRSTKVEIAALSVEQRLAYRECQVEALRVWCDQEWEGDVTKVTDKLTEQGQTKEQILKLYENTLGEYCPNPFNIPLNGPPTIAVQQIEKRGGPGFLEGWMSAAPMLARAFQDRFPKCNAQRKSIGLVADPKGCFEGWFKNIE